MIMYETMRHCHMHHGTMITLHTIGLYSEVLMHAVLCYSAVWTRKYLMGKCLLYTVTIRLAVSLYISCTW